MSHLLLTGASGLVGSGYRDLFPGRITAISRRATPGFLQLDLTLDDWSALDQHRNSIDAILHCAADTRFGAPWEELRAANVAATAKLLQFARTCPRLRKFGHVSTVFVAGQTTGVIPEERLSRPVRFTNRYQRSKFAAEQLVFEAMADLPASIYRFSTILGNSQTGEVRQFNHSHHLLRLLPRNVLPIAPGLPDAPVDLIASDWAVKTLFDLFEDEFQPGAVRHICAGPAAALRVDEMVRLAIRTFESNPRGRHWLPIHAPELRPLAEFDCWARTVGDPLLKELLRVLSLFLPHLGLKQEFQCSGRVAEGCGVTAAELFTRVAHYCIDTNWGRNPASNP